MTQITKIPLKIEADAELEALKDSAATQRALDYYLKPSVTQRCNEQKVFNVSDDVGYEEALLHASELMRFALTYAHGGAASVQGPHLDLIRGMAHFVEMAKDLVDKTIDKQKAPAR
ncbi:DUF3077 domain-containing protein [Pseudomonas lundensis]|uniref:DUF6124 family protein n=1 Tax=Pseudomonas lundensis TaxID=86185 RepID=UPI0006426405|nr:DUF3077 domain-containing protein [Pseudomonas lundensis]AOZ14218.1 DUF3077 domain-containing protein [Pseudomonas lundensis]QVQ78526.1 DUF3077 domain-containing protein [Pseudomonas lundensis]QVQ82412.1 DUF3077 domain-containing protein [Pseudomonas lundensis]